jgi:hypothetical protein
VIKIGQAILQFENMNEDELKQVRQNLQGMGRYIDKQLPYRWGFVLLTFPFGADGRMEYVSNAQRADVVRALYEFIEITKGKWAEHVPEESSAAEDEQLGRARQRIAELEGYLAQAAEVIREADAEIAKLKREG